MLSLDRKIWIEGPDLPMFTSFNHANGIALNKTVVLFVGVGSLPFQVDVFNKKTIIYDFNLIDVYKQQMLIFFLIMTFF